jgi:hypothetical protein
MQPSAQPSEEEKAESHEAMQIVAKQHPDRRESSDNQAKIRCAQSPYDTSAPKVKHSRVTGSFQGFRNEKNRSKYEI